MSDSQAFLTAEQAAKKLLADLQALKAEVGGYARARGNLDEAAAAVGNLSNKAEAVVSGLEQLAAVSARLGTPEILKSVEAVREYAKSAASQSEQAAQGQGAVREAVAALQPKLEAIRSGINVAASGSESQFHSLRKDLAGQLKSASEIHDQRGREIVGQIDKRAAEASKAIADARADETSGTAAALKLIRWTVIFAAASAVLAGAALIVAVVVATRIPPGT